MFKVVLLLILIMLFLVLTLWMIASVVITLATTLFAGLLAYSFLGFNTENSPNDDGIITTTITTTCTNTTTTQTVTDITTGTTTNTTTTIYASCFTNITSDLLIMQAYTELLPQSPSTSILPNTTDLVIVNTDIECDAKNSPCEDARRTVTSTSL